MATTPSDHQSQRPVTRWAEIMLLVNAAAVVALAMYAFVLPGVTVIRDIADPRLATSEIPGAALRLHTALTPRFEGWARNRLSSGRAAALSTNDISGTEWPLFGSVFYLWATEALQEAWEKQTGPKPQAPAVSARGAIEAATDLVLDPRQAAWVEKHWGEHYLSRENVFYRMLVISAATAHARLTGESTHVPFLRQQVDSLATELARSPHGLLDDYPGQCYPADVLAAVAAIARADAVLQTDHRRFVDEARRAFGGELLDEHGLVPYLADAAQGRGFGGARGCSNSYVSLLAPGIWPDLAAAWYRRYEEHFFQDRWTAVGFREFPRDAPGYDWYIDVDSGPVVAGHGIAANAFGVGAARVNGRFDHAYPLAAEMLVLSWPLPDGTLALPRLLSNVVDAPYLGEAGVLYNLTRVPVRPISRRAGGLPLFVYLMTSVYFLLGAALLVSTFRLTRRKWRHLVRAPLRWRRLQLAVWGAFTVAAAVAMTAQALVVTMVLVVMMNRMPVQPKSGASD